MSGGGDGRAKPLDFGAYGVNGSLDACGRLIALNAFHPVQGYVTLTTAEPFPEAERYNPAAVRAYRAGLAGLEGFGIHFGQAVVSSRAGLLDDAIPSIHLELAGGATADVTSFAAGGGAFQHWEIVGEANMRWGGRISLQRCAYTQLTEGGPIPPPPIETHIRFHDGLLTIENPALEWAVAIAGLPALPSTEAHHDGHIDFYIDLPAENLTLAYGFGENASAATQHARQLAERDLLTEMDDLRGRWSDRWQNIPSDPVLRRGLSYSLSMAVPVGEGACFLTDHILLPLVWNRDAYYMARALLNWSPDMADVVRQHLIWMFEVADRPNGLWGRCYLANGRVKDVAFQLDQQLFPLLELAEYVLKTGDQETLQRLRGHIPPLMDRLMARRSPHAALFPTDETPADDPIALPYHLSSHILFWHTLRMLEKVEPGYAALAADLRAAIDRYFIADYEGKRLYAYATDGAGAFHFYHDANDFPLVLAPLWGLCGADDPIWRATIDFAFSPANVGGFYDGHLGSVHTRAPWPLGDIQALMVARLTGDSDREAAALAHLQAITLADGSLPEAYDAATGAVVSRYWFGWPPAAYACAQLNAFAEFVNT